MRTTTLQEIKEVAAVHGIVIGGLAALFAVVAVVQMFAAALTT